MNSAPATPLKGPAVGGAEMSFFEALEARAKQANSLLCVGLDPHTTELSESSAEAAEAFCLKLIKATSDVAAAYKPNAAFFEVFGAPGAAALGRVIAAIQKVCYLRTLILLPCHNTPRAALSRSRRRSRDMRRSRPGALACPPAPWPTPTSV